jgi:hypothetical protein
MRVYALADLDDRLAVDVFVRREDAFAELEALLQHELGWTDFLHVVPIELDERELSLN